MLKKLNPFSKETVELIGSEPGTVIVAPPSWVGIPDPCWGCLGTHFQRPGTHIGVKDLFWQCAREVELSEKHVIGPDDLDDPKIVALINEKLAGQVRHHTLEGKALPLTGRRLVLFGKGTLSIDGSHVFRGGLMSDKGTWTDGEQVVCFTVGNGSEDYNASCAIQIVPKRACDSEGHPIMLKREHADAMPLRYA